MSQLKQIRTHVNHPRLEKFQSFENCQKIEQHCKSCVCYIDCSIQLGFLDNRYQRVHQTSRRLHLNLKWFGWSTFGLKEILRRIWLLSANKIKPSESICQQLSQFNLKLVSINQDKIIFFVYELLLGSKKFHQ